MATAPRAIPAGWPVKPAAPVWEWLARRRAPQIIEVAGAEGGVGVSTVTALVADTLAAGSPGPTVVLDQSGSPWGSLTRRLLGERGGLPAGQARDLLARGLPPTRVLATAPTSLAGAAILSDPPGYTPIREIGRLAQTACGALVIDSGTVDLVTATRQDLRPLLVLVGRADTIGAEAVCAAAGFLRHYGNPPGSPPAIQQQIGPPRLLVVLVCAAPADRRRVQAASRLVRAADLPDPVVLPFDPRLTAGQVLRLDQVARATADACLHLVRGITFYQQEAHNHGH
jgi:hypothetical protein